ncbi:MAG: VWA domain-containing protein [Clostridiaceae bacterium]|nr:VWA domain-containing protein [Clostridiaceae bacterium]
MEIQVQKGQKIDITKNHGEIKNLSVEMYWKVISQENSSDFEIDSAAFLLDSSGKTTKDEDFIFYNNPLGGEDSVLHNSNPHKADAKEQLKIKLEKLPKNVEKIAFTLTINNGEERSQSFKQVRGLTLHILNEDTGEKILTYAINEVFSVETAIVVAEIYLYKGEWKFNAIASGFSGGLAALCKNFGIQVEEEKVEKINLSKINLLKKKVMVILEKKKLTGVLARVALVLDISGSMHGCYKRGTVQNVLDRITAVAAKFDDDGNLDMWMFDHRFHRLPLVNENNYENYIHREILDKSKKGVFKGKIFGANDEPPVMRDVIHYYTKENKSQYPTFVVFISDGGVSKNSEIKKIMIEASQYSIFWQFVGIGNANYGILEKLDSMPGRVVDNANFFSLDDVDKISDEDLYDRLLTEFPAWLKEARIKKIL